MPATVPLSMLVQVAGVAVLAVAAVLLLGWPGLVLWTGWLLYALGDAMAGGAA